MLQLMKMYFVAPPSVEVLALAHAHGSLQLQYGTHHAVVDMRVSLFCRSKAS